MERKKEIQIMTERWKHLKSHHRICLVLSWHQPQRWMQWSHRSWCNCSVSCLFFQAPKTPLQKSMDLLGKQLSLYSFGIIGGCTSRSPVVYLLSFSVSLRYLPVFSLMCVLVVLQGSSCWWAGCRGRGSWTCSPSESGRNPLIMNHRHGVEEKVRFFCSAK